MHITKQLAALTLTLVISSSVFAHDDHATEKRTHANHETTRQQPLTARQQAGETRTAGLLDIFRPRRSVPTAGYRTSGYQPYGNSSCRYGQSSRIGQYRPSTNYRNGYSAGNPYRGPSQVRRSNYGSYGGYGSGYGNASGYSNHHYSSGQNRFNGNRGGYGYGYGR